jgi:hypothetical protein
MSAGGKAAVINNHGSRYIAGKYTAPLSGAVFCFQAWSRLVYYAASPNIAPVSRIMAQDRCDWPLGWTEYHSRRYGVREDQVQAYLDQPGPG